MKGEQVSESVEIVRLAAEFAGKYLDGLDGRPVAPADSDLAAMSALDVSLPDGPRPAGAVVHDLDRICSSATMASAGGRYFGFVVGGSLPAALGVSLLATAWDQMAGLHASSPAAAALEEAAAKWVLEALGLPGQAGIGFVTGATMANFTGLAAARHALLARQGWNVEDQGLFGAPEVAVFVGEEVHASLLKALALAGFGRARVTRLPADGQGLVSFGDPGRTRRVIEAVQRDGTCWAGGTVWQGRTAMRISVSSCGPRRKRTWT